jgi:hypothetical protein
MLVDGVRPDVTISASASLLSVLIAAFGTGSVEAPSTYLGLGIPTGTRTWVEFALVWVDGAPTSARACLA